MNDSNEFYLKTYTLEYTKRFSMKQTIHKESVATHSYFVCLGVMLLHEDYSFNLGLALEMAVAHDVPEMGISDVNHKVKVNHPELAAAVRQVEEKFALSLPESIQRSYFLHLDDSKVESKIVKYADAWQCWQYAMNEWSLGNTHMGEVIVSTEKRMNEIAIELKEGGHCR